MATIIYNTGSTYYGGLVTNSDGLPPGGAPGQVLIKASYNDYDAVWATATIDGTVEGGGGTGTGGDIVLDSIAPIRVSGGGSAWTISIDAASSTRPGSMSAADKRRLDQLPTWVGDTPPVGARINDLWYDSSIGRLFIRFQDAKGGVQWVDTNPQGAGSGQAQGIYFGEQPPSNPLAWAGWYDTTIGNTFLWFDDGSSSQWVPASPQGAGASKEVYISSTPPVDVPVESLWWDSQLGRLFILYDDGNSTQWVDASPEGGSQGKETFFGDLPPADPLNWSCWFDTSIGNTFLWYDDGSSSQWVPVSPQGGENGSIDEGSYGA